MKKPSERIFEIVDAKYRDTPDAFIRALLDYLDEQHARDLELADFTKSGERKE